MDTQKMPDSPATEPFPTFLRLPFVSNAKLLDIAIAGVPFDGGTRLRVGSRQAPRQIRTASELLHGLHLKHGFSPLDLCTLGDVGDVVIAPFDQDANLAAIEAFFAELWDSGAAPVAIGGDHLITLPILRAIGRTTPLAVVQFDAHADTAMASPEGARFTSSTPFRRAVEEGLVDPRRFVQIGLRGTLGSMERMDWARAQGIRQFTVDEMYDIGIDAVIRETRSIIGHHPTYVTFDIDGIDPAYAPGTGTPVVGGFSSYEAQRILRGLSGAAVIGGDVTEVSPPYDLRGITALLGASLVHEIICLVAQTRAGRKEGLQPASSAAASPN